MLDIAQYRKPRERAQPGKECGAEIRLVKTNLNIPITFR